MNKHLYRIVFNRALRIYQVVCELVRQPHGGGRTDAGTSTTGVRPLSFALWIVLGFVAAPPVFAQVIGDRNAPGSQRPTVLGSQGNAALIDIQTPSAAGVSRNTYSQFDVDNHGAVLNNSRTNTTTQLAREVAGNPWLATGTAKIILNEVTGPHPSQLNGYVEVAGDRAQVIIANPAGIACDGCGFIHANRVTLTTGTPVLRGGALDGYRVSGGAIRVDGKGLDATQADYTDLITRSLQVNAGIWTPQLQVTAGANQVNADQSQVTPLAAPGAAPVFAVDVSALGGMYANKIQLVGTELGVGVRNAGNIGARAGDLVVTADGRLENTGNLQSQNNTQLAASGGIANAGTISASRELTLATPQDVDNSQGTLNAARIAIDADSLRNQGGRIAQTGAQAMSLQAGGLSNRAGSIGAPGSDSGAGTDTDTGSSTTTGAAPPATDTGNSDSNGDGSATPGSAPVSPLAPLADGVLHISGLLDNDGGKISAASGFDLSSDAGLANDGGHLTLRQLTLGSGDLSNRSGTLTIDGASSLHVDTLANDGGQLTFNGPLSLNAQTLSNRAGTIQQIDTGATALAVAGTFDNSDGTLASNASALAISSGTLINERGTIQHAGRDGLRVTTSGLYGAGGKIATRGAVMLTAGAIDHRGATLTATQLTLTADSLDNRGGTLATSGTDADTLHVAHALDNGDGGVLAANGDLAVQADILGNATGTIQHAGTGTLTIAATTLNGAGGTIESNGTLNLAGHTTDLGGGTTTAQNIAITTDALSTRGAVVIAENDLTIHAGALDNRDTRSADPNVTQGLYGQQLTLDVGSFDNRQGQMQASDGMQIHATGTVDNSGGLLAAAGASTIQAGNLANLGGAIQTLGAPLAITTGDLLDNSASGLIATDGDLSLSAATMNNMDGSIQHAGTGTLAIRATTFTGAHGSIASNGTLNLTGDTTDLSNATTTAQRLAITAGTLTTAGGSLQALGGHPLQLSVRGAMDNHGGTIASNGALLLSVGSLNNDGGSLLAAGVDATQVQVAGAFDNTGGTLATAGATTLHAGNLINGGGILQAAAASPLTLSVDGLLSNDQGSLQSNGDVELTAGSLSNHGGTVQTPGAIHATVANTLDNSGGALIAGGDVAIDAATLLNRNTLNTDANAPATGLYGQQVTLHADTVDNSTGQVVARDALDISGGALSNVSGVLDGQNIVSLSGTSLDNTGGQLIQHGDAGTLTMNVSQGLINTAGGIIGAEGSAQLHAGAWDSSGGTTVARHDLTLASDDAFLNRDNGLLQSGGALTLTVGGVFDNSAGTLDATQAATIHAASVSNVGGQLLGDSLALTTAGALDNRGGTIGSRGSDVALAASTVDNSTNGTLVAQNDLTIDTGAWNNASGTVYANRNLTYQTGGSSLDNTAGQFGAGDTATLNLAQITNTAGHIQADTLWLTAPTLNNDGGKIEGNAVYATLATLNGQGRLYGADLLDAHVTGDYTHLAGQRLESDGVLNLAVDGTLTNQGTLQTAGELDIAAANVINTAGATINASASEGSASAHITAAGSIDNQNGASLEGDALTLSAHDVTNTGNITGNTVRIDASTLTNGADLGQATDNAAYQSGLIAAADALALYVSEALLNRDATLYSQGDLIIAGDDSGSRVQSVTNLSGDIEAGGNLALSAQQLTNARRVIVTGTLTLSPAEQAANAQTITSPMYVYDDPLAAHQVPNIDADQVVSAAHMAKAMSYCDAYSGSDTRCVFFQDGNHTGYPSNYQSTTTDTLLSVTTITAASAQSRLLSGGDMALDGALVNNASTIAAGRNLSINGQAGAASTDSVQNIAWVPTGLVQTTVNDQIQSQYLIDNPRTWLLGDWWTYDTATSTQSMLLGPGNQPGWMSYDAGPGLNASITAGGSLSINGGDITNTVVGRSDDGSVITPGALSGPGNTALTGASTAQAGSAGNVRGVTGQAANGPGGTQRLTSQTVGTADLALPNLATPSNGIYSQHGDPNAPFLVTTAPRFAGSSTSSNYLLQALGYDPSNIQKRLGDGYYEQNLVMDQVLQLTGRRTLNGDDGLAQYQSLMDNAAAQAQALGLSLGAPLTSAQIASLSSDIVWLVDQVVDGQHVLVPVVYLSKATAYRLNNDGALMAGDAVNIQASGTVRNDGTITGSQGTWLSADTLINQGAIKSAGTLAIATRNDAINAGSLSGGAVSVMAGRDVVSTGAITSTGDMALMAGRDLTVGVAPVQAAGNLSMIAGRDLTATASTLGAGGDAQLVAGNNLTLDATARTTRTQSGQTVQENLTHAVSTVSAGGNLALVAGNDLTGQGAQLGAGNQLGLAAGHDVTLNAVTDSQSVTSASAQGHTVTRTATYDETVKGSTLSGANGVAVSAGHDLTATATTITSANGNVGLLAGNDLTLATARENHRTVTDTKTTRSGLLSSSTQRTHDSVSDSLAIGTTVSGSNVSMAAANDLTATAAQIVADHDIVMAAGNNLTLNTANDVHTEEHSISKTKSGLMGAGVGVMVGQAKQSQDATITQTTPTGTTVGSLGGSVTMTAGNTVHLTNATVLSDTGTAIVGKAVTIDAAVGTTDITQTYKQSSSGLTVGLGGTAVQAAQGAYAAAHRGSEVKDDRLTALYAAQAAYGVSDGVNALQQMGGTNGISKSGTDGGINLQLGVGGSSAKAITHTHDETAYGSTIHSNGNVLIAATDGDLNVIGSQITGDNVGLMASNDINLLSQTENHSLTNTNENASGGVGVQIGTDGIGLYAQASMGKGSAHGNGTTHATTSVDAKNTLSLVSGSDTTLQGAQAKGNTVLADIGGNLSIISEQDTDDYASKQQQASGKVVVGYGVSASGSYNQSKVDSHYASVTTVSGIGAGDGGFNIHVNGNTDLKAGVIASTADASKNALDTGSLTFSNIENSAKYDASSLGISGGTGASGKVAALGPAGISPGLGIPQGDSTHNTTQAGIANGTIIIRDGNANLDALDRTASLDQAGLNPIFDAQKVQEQQEMSQLAGYVGMRTVGDISQYMASHASTDADKAAWSDGGANKVILHGMVGAATAALGGGDALGGALGAGASEAASGAMQDYLRSQGIDPYSAEGKSLMQLGSVAIGAMGGGAGAATALQGEQFNRQLHQSEIDWIQGHAKDFASQQCGCDPSAEQISNATQQLAQQAARQTDVLWAASLPGDDSAARQYLAGAQVTFTNTLGNAQKLFTVEGNQYLQPMMYLPDASANRGFYQSYLQPGAGNVNTGLQVMLAQASVNAYLNQGETAWNAATGAINGIGNAILHPVDTFNGAGQDLGNNAAYALNAGLVSDQLRAVYGQDVSSAAATLATLNTSLTLLGATGAGKGAAAAVEGAAKSAAVDALTAAVQAGWKGDAAGLEQFTRTVIGNTGSVNRFLSADAVNATMDTYNWSPAWQSGTMVADATIKPGTVVNMVVDEQTYRAIEKGDMSRAFGGWATFDDVPNQAYARNELAITSQMKPDASYVIQVEVTKAVNAQIGVVGDQPGAMGGGNQLHFNLPPEQRVETFKVIGTSELH